MVLAACQSQPDPSREVREVAVARLALPAEARVVADPAVSPAGPAGRVETQACVAGKPGADVAASTKAALAPSWGDVQIIPNAAVPGRWVLVGGKDGYGGYGVSGLVDEVRRGPCTEGEVYVSLGVHALAAEGAGDGARGAGVRGVRSAAAGRLPVVLTPVADADEAPARK
jgi:hypothetical protein